MRIWPIRFQGKVARLRRYASCLIKRQYRSRDLHFPTTLTALQFKARCVRYLKRNGWALDWENSLLHTIFWCDGIGVRLFFLLPGQLPSSTMITDWMEVKATTNTQIAIITGNPIPPDTSDFASKVDFILIDYKRMDFLKIATCQMLEKRRHAALEHKASFEGFIDRFESPSIIWGWVKFLGPNGLLKVLEIQILKDGELVAKGTPNRPRPDVTHDPVFPAGFGIDCGEKITRQDFVDKRVQAIARDMEGQIYHIKIWHEALRKARLQSLLDLHPNFARTDLARLLIQGSLE